MLMDPSGSPVAVISPSLATTSREPSGVNVHMSGPWPTSTAAMVVPSGRRNRTWPGPPSSLGTATAITSPDTATDVGAGIACVATRTGRAGSRMSITSSPAAPFTTHSERVGAW